MGNCNFKTEKENSELCKYSHANQGTKLMSIHLYRNHKGSLRFLVSDWERWFRKSMEGREQEG